MAKDHNLKEKDHKANNILALIIGCAIAGILIFIVISRVSSPDWKNSWSNMFKTPTPTLSPTPRPTPRPIAQGKQVYNVSVADDAKGPRIYQLEIDPFDPKRGEIQTLLVKVNDKQGVDAISIILMTDNGVKTYPLYLVAGTKESGTWKSNWTTEDTHNYIYGMKIQATGASGTSKVEPMFR